MAGQDDFLAEIERAGQRRGWTVGKDRVEISFPTGRHQTVHFELFDFEGEARARLYTAIGSAVRIDPLRLTQALRVSFKLPHGALALRDDDLVMVDTLSADEVDASELEATLRYLAETADHLEQTMFGSDEN
jgi:hypothetical protein